LTDDILSINEVSGYCLILFGNITFLQIYERGFKK